MTEFQRTLDGRLEPVGSHRLDPLWCEDVNEEKPREETRSIGEYMAVCADGGFLCVDCADTECVGKRIDPNCPDDKQWAIAGWQRAEPNHGSTCSHCGRETMHVFYREESLEDFDVEHAGRIDEYNHGVFDQFFKNTEEWISDYVQSDDYRDDYTYLLHESPERATDAIADWLDDSTNSVWLSFPNESPEPRVHKEYHAHYGIHPKPGAYDTCYYPGFMRRKRFSRKFVDMLFDDIYHMLTIESSAVNEYSTTSGDVFLDSFSVGEHEEQIELSRVQEEIGDKLCYVDNGVDANKLSQLADLLIAYDSKQRDYCLRDINAKSLARDYPCFYLYLNTGLRIDYYVSSETLHEALVRCTIGYCQKTDFRRKERSK